MSIGRSTPCIALCATALVLSASTALPARSEMSHPRPIRFKQIDLVSDIPGRAEITDPDLINPWGITNKKRLGVSDADADMATFYTGGGKPGAIKKDALQFTVEGGPTGQVRNGGHHFVVEGPDGEGPARYIFATESGTIAAWNRRANPDAAIEVASIEDAVFKGLAKVRVHHHPFLLAADFFHAKVQVFDPEFNRLGSFRAHGKCSVPDGYAPFNVANIRGRVFVTFAQQSADDPGEEVTGPGKGFVREFTRGGRCVRKFINRGPLNAPWAVTIAPFSFGKFADRLLIGNFGDGRINGFNLGNANFRGPLRRPSGEPIEIDGLWGLVRGNNNNGGTRALWFAAGIEDEEHGLVGLIRPKR